MGLAVWDLLRRRRWIVCQNILLACRLLKRSLSPKFSQDCILDFFTVEAADFRSSVYCEFREESASTKWLFFALIRHTESFPSAYPSSIWSYSCFEQLPLHLRICCAFRELSEQGLYAVCIFVRLVLTAYGVGPPSPAYLVFQDVSCRPPGGDWSTVLHPLTRMFNVQHNKYCRNQWVIIDSKNLCTRCILVKVPALEESVYDAHCVVTAHLQNEPSVNIYVSIVISADQTLPYSSIVPNVCIEVAQKGREFVSFNSSQGITNFFHEFRVHCTWVWAVYLFQTQGAI